MDTHFNRFFSEHLFVQAIHTAVKGRARYKVSGLHYSETLKKYLELRLSKEEIVTRVSANQLTGNILVIYHPDFNSDAIALHIQHIVLDYIKENRITPLQIADTNTAPEKAEDLLINQGKLNQQNLHDWEQKIPSWYGRSADAAITKFNTSAGSGLSSTRVEEKPKQYSPNVLLQTAYRSQSSIFIKQFKSLPLAPLAVAVGLSIATGRLAGIDREILLTIQKLHAPLLDRIMVGITFLGDPVVLLLICLGLGSGLTYYNRRSEATSLGITAVGAIGLNCWLKALFGRARPALWDRIIDVGLHSFPSGHAMVSIAIYGFLGYILAKQFPQWRGRIFALTAILIIAIGFSRLYLGVHWPTDVTAGYAIGLAWLLACIASLELSVVRSQTANALPKQI